MPSRLRREEAADANDHAEALYGLALAAIFGERPSADKRLEALGELAIERQGHSTLPDTARPL